MTRRGSIDALAARLTGLYDAREARSIALAAVAELSGLSPSALLTDPEVNSPSKGWKRPQPVWLRASRCNTSSDTRNFTAAASPCAKGF